MRLAAPPAKLSAKLCCDSCMYFIRSPVVSRRTLTHAINCFCLEPLRPLQRKHFLRTITVAQQPQELFNVSVNIRMSAVRLGGSRAWVRERAQPQTAYLVTVRVESGGERVLTCFSPSRRLEFGRASPDAKQCLREPRGGPRCYCCADSVVGLLVIVVAVPVPAAPLT